MTKQAKPIVLVIGTDFSEPRDHKSVLARISSTLPTWVIDLVYHPSGIGLVPGADENVAAVIFLGSDVTIGNVPFDYRAVLDRFSSAGAVYIKN